jgi:hypothetical protein
VFFFGGVASSNPPTDGASDAEWMASYTGTGKRWSHVASGVFLILAALSLMTFLTGMWQRISSARPAGATSPLPLVAAGVATTCMAVGGTLMGYVSGAELSGNYPLPSADFLRFSNGFGFGVTGIAGMLAAAVCLTVLAHQARTAGVFGRNLAIFTWIVALILLASVLFFPIAALMIWIVVCIISARGASPAPAAHPHQPEDERGTRAPAATS